MTPCRASSSAGCDALAAAGFHVAMPDVFLGTDIAAQVHTVAGMLWVPPLPIP